MALNKDALEQLMLDAGLGERDKKKLRSANQPPSETPADDAEPRRPRGHGPASQTQPVIDGL